MGKLTNITLAIKKDPSIIDRVRIVWLGSNYPDPGEYNLVNDTTAINPLLESGVIVVSDRYLHSSLAYQSVTTGDSGWVEEINKFARKPDLGIYLDVRPSEGLKRLKRKQKTRFEREDFLNRVRERYLEYARANELVKVDAEKTLEEVFSEVTSIVERALKERR